MEQDFLQRNQLYPTMMRSAGSKLKENNRNRRFGRKDKNPLKNKTSRHINKYQHFKIDVQDDGLIKVEVNEEALGGKFTDEELKMITEVLATEIEYFIKEHGDTAIDKLKKMKLPTAQEIFNPDFSLQRIYEENFYK